MTLATIISYCTNDYRFIGKCIEEAKRFSQIIIIPVCDHFFDGTPENRKLLEWTYSQHPDCRFIEFAYSPKELYTLYSPYTSADEEWVRLWHATSRYIGFLHLPPEVEFVLFLDSDEIVEGARFLDWLKTKEHEKWNAFRLLSYYYVLRPTFRAKKLQAISLFACKAAIEPRFLFHPDERHALFRYLPEPKHDDYRSHDGKPLIHHYSWVRTKEECLRKVSSWGHRWDRDWPSAIQAAFADDASENLFGMDLDFEEIPVPFFDPFSVSVSFSPPQSFGSVKKVDRRAMFRMEVDALL